MKTLNLLLGIFFTVFSVYGQNTFTLEGDIRNMPDTVTFGCAEMKGSTGRIMVDDFVTMVNGKFKITREIDKTTKMFLSINNTGYLFWVKPGANLKITGKAPYVQTWRTESDIPIPEQIELNRFKEATLEEHIQIHDLKTECMKLIPQIKANDSIARYQFDSLRQEVNKIHNQGILYKELQVMLDNPITLAGMEELRDAAKCSQEGKFNDLPLIKSVYNKLTDEQKESQLGKEIISLLSISSTVKTGDKIFDTELMDIEGNIHHLSDHKGKYILLDFWSRACGPCIAALPELRKIAEQYKGEVIVVSVSVDPVSVWKEEVKDPVTNWLQLSDGLESSGIAAHYEIQSLPTFIYISPEGVIMQIKKGYRENSLLEEIDGFIKDKQPN